MDKTESSKNKVIGYNSINHHYNKSLSLLLYYYIIIYIIYTIPSTRRDYRTLVVEAPVQLVVQFFTSNKPTASGSWHWPRGKVHQWKHFTFGFRFRSVKEAHSWININELIDFKIIQKSNHSNTHTHISYFTFLHFVVPPMALIQCFNQQYTRRGTKDSKMAHKSWLYLQRRMCPVVSTPHFYKG